ncbi:MAG: DUF1698 domain-containing protein [Thermoanaerobaculia bacterium]
MTPEEIEAGVERLRPWFHQIDLGHGIRTKTASASGEHVDHPLPTWDYIRHCLPDDLTGKSVIDIGCNGGFYSVEAKRRNAARVLGVDAQRYQVRQAQFVRRALGLDIEFRRMSVYDLTPRTVGVFDVTLALGLVYHLKHLVLALENLFQITRELLVLETAILMSDAFVGEATYPGSTQNMVLHPMAYIDNAADAKEPVYNWFLPSPKAMEALLRNVGFEDVSIFSVHGDRAVLVCRKREGAAERPILSQLAGRVTIEAAPAACDFDTEFSILARVENTGQALWPVSGEPETGKGAVRLGAHLLRDDDVAVWEYGLTALPHDLGPEESERLELKLRTPVEPGRYVVELDLLAEQLTWFEDLGTSPATVELEVVGPQIPWYRSEGVRAGLENVGLPVPRTDASPSERFATLLAGTVLAMSRVSNAEAVKLAFEWIVGHSPDAEATAHYTRVLESEPDGARKLVREFLLRWSAGAVPLPPEDARLHALAERMGAPLSTLSVSAAERGESFAGEAGFARRLLEESRGLADAAFVELAYRKVLGRSAEAEGRDYVLGKLERKELGRPRWVRELLWSDELRGCGLHSTDR